MNIRSIGSCAALLLALSATAPRAQTYLSETDAGETYNIQGEYVGTVGTKAYGVQVVAWGGNAFEAMILTGGLPGQGWVPGAKNWKSIKGSTSGNNTIFTASGWSLLIPKGGASISGAGPDGKASLAKVFRESPSLGWKPSGVTVLFDGTQASLSQNWSSGHLVNGQYLSEGSNSTKAFTDHTLHIEFRPPLEPQQDGQERGNSGVYVQGRYEVQVLDSYGWQDQSAHGSSDGWAGGIFSQRGADFNMAFPPLRWQTYDIWLTHPKFNGNTKIANGRITIFHNGVKVQDDVELQGTTPGNYEGESPAGGKLALQDHGGPMWYRNIWVAPGKFLPLPAGSTSLGKPTGYLMRPPRARASAFLSLANATVFPSGAARALFRVDGAAAAPAGPASAGVPAAGCYFLRAR